MVAKLQTMKFIIQRIGKPNNVAICEAYVGARTSAAENDIV